MATRMQQRRGTASQWTSADPILAAGEIGFETDTGKFKIGNGSSQWSSLVYYASAEDLAGLLDGAPELLDTLNELAAAIGDDPSFITTVATNLSNHQSDTTNIHGIANTANLATLDDVADAVANAEVDQSTLAGVGIDWNQGTGQFDIDNTVVTLSGTQTLTNKTLTSADLGSSSIAVTQNATDSTTKIATTQFVQERISAVVAGSPDLLNTLSELSSAINNDENFATTVGNTIAQKVAKDGDTMTGSLTLSGAPTENLHAATKAYVDSELSSHQSDTTSVHGIADTTALATKTYADNAVSTHGGDTTSVHGIADTALLATQEYANDAVSTHNLDTTDVHGIADTTALATKTYADNAVSTHSSDTTNVHGIGDTANLATKAYADDAVSTHSADTTGVHGIADTTALVVTTDSRLSDTRTPTDNTVSTDKIVNLAVTDAKLAADAVTTAKILNGAVTSAKIADGTIVDADINASAAIAQSKISGLTTDLAAKAPLASPTFTGTVSGITKSMVGLGNVDNTSDANKPVSTATQTALDLKAPLAGPTFTGTVTLPSTTSIGNVSATELGYVDGVTSAIQTQLDSKLALAGGTMTGALTLSGAPTADLHAATKAYVDNVTAGINFHQPVRVATTANITLSGTQTIDGVALSVGDRVLVKDQTDQKQNGIYVVASGAWSRATDADNTPAGELAGGDFSLVLEGTVNSGYGYVCSNTSAITIGTTNITYAAFNAAKAVTAGSGLTESTPGTLDIATGGVTSAMIADGTIVNGDISASAAIDQSKISGLSASLAAKADLASPTFTGTVTLPAAGIVFSDGTQSKEGVPSRTTIQQKTASYTLSALTERDNFIEVNSASATTISIPTDASVNFPVGTSIDILQTGAGQVTIAAVTPATTTVNGTPGLKLRTQWSSATLFKRAANLWVVMGDLSA